MSIHVYGTNNLEYTPAILREKCFRVSKSRIDMELSFWIFRFTNRRKIDFFILRKTKTRKKQLNQSTPPVTGGCYNEL